MKVYKIFKIKLKIFLIYTIILINFLELKSKDINIIGQCRFRDSLSRIAISFIECLKNDLDINFCNISQNSSFEDINESTAKIIKSSKNNIKNDAKINLLVAPIGYGKYNNNIDKFLSKDQINIAYSMFESDRIPQFWVETLNTKFDLVIVPDDFLIKVYQNSGVKIPVFSIPLPIFIDEFLDNNNEHKFDPNKPFTFGCSCMFVPYKNQEKIIKAFAKEFSDKNRFKLKLHGRSGNIGYIKNIIKELNLENVEIILSRLSNKDYIDFIKSLDCYIFISKGEGFSITPREAMACAIPVILSNHSVHQTLVKSNFVYPIKADIPVKSYFQLYFKNDDIGFQYDCNINDIVNSMKDIFYNYAFYKKRAIDGKQWIKNYNFESIKKLYLNIFKPKYIQIGDKNDLINNGIITNSKNLFKKFKKLIGI